MPLSDCEDYEYEFESTPTPICMTCHSSDEDSYPVSCDESKVNDNTSRNQFGGINIAYSNKRRKILDQQYINNQYHFLMPPNDTFTCEICQFPNNEASLIACCGHTFCKHCLKGAASNANACPVCHSEEFVTIPYKQVEKAVKNLCASKEKGCKWEGDLSDISKCLVSRNVCQFEDMMCFNGCEKMLQQPYLTNHVEDECINHNTDWLCGPITGKHQLIEGELKEQCPEFPIACPTKCVPDSILCEDIDQHSPLEEIMCPYDYGKAICRQYPTNHVKMSKCQYCHIAGENQFIEGEHKEQCPKFPIACPNKCEVGSVPRDDIEEHIKICPLELIQCEYGCGERMARKDKKKHNMEKMKEHYTLIMQHQFDSSQIQSCAVNTEREIGGGYLTADKNQFASIVDKILQKLQQVSHLITFQITKYRYDVTGIVESEANSKSEVDKDDFIHNNDACLFHTSTPESDQLVSHSYQCSVDFSKYDQLHSCPVYLPNA